MNDMLVQDKLITPKFDLVFKKIYGSENDNIPIRIFLKEVLNIIPKRVKVLNSEIIGIPYNDKKVLVDLIVELDDDSIVIVEINTQVNKPLYDRNLFYVCKIIGNDLKPGEHYDKLKKHILINLDFEGAHEEPIMEFNLTNKKTRSIYSNKLEIMTIDIPYYRKKCYTNREDVSKLSKQEKFLGLFDIDDKNLAYELSKGDNDMEEIYNKIKECNNDDEIIGAYDAEWHRSELARLGMLQAKKDGMEQGMEQGIEQGIKRGIKQGIRDEKEKVIMNMLKENISIDIISKVTGLSIEEINKISKN